RGVRAADQDERCPAAGVAVDGTVDAGTHGVLGGTQGGGGIEPVPQVPVQVRGEQRGGLVGDRPQRDQGGACPRGQQGSGQADHLLAVGDRAGGGLAGVQYHQACPHRQPHQLGGGDPLAVGEQDTGVQGRVGIVVAVGG